MTWWMLAALVPVGFALGTLGTFMGIGGGFLLVPMLAVAFPRLDAPTITSISLAVVFFNAGSGSLAYSRQRRIDYVSAAWFSIAAVPGAMVGAWTTYLLPQRLFLALFGGLMAVASLYLLVHPEADDGAPATAVPRGTTRRLIDAEGVTYEYSYSGKLGMGLSAVVGYVSSLLGIGGGVIHVPLLTRVLSFPVHVATATSHLVLAITALTATVVHAASGSFHGDALRIPLLLSLGVVPGAQLGARLAARATGAWIVRSLAVALAAVAIRVLYQAVG